MIWSTDFWTLTPSAAFIVCRVFAWGHSGQCEVIMRWSLICISLIFSNVDIFSCGFLKLCELNLLIEMASWNPALFWIFFQWPPLRRFLRAGLFYLQPCRPCQCPSAMASELLPWEMGTGQCVFVPDFGYWGHQSLRERPVPGLSEGKVPAETPRPVSCSFLPHPLDKLSSCNPTLWRVLSSRWGNSKEGAGGGNPTTRRHGALGAFQSSSSPEGPHILWVQ